MSLKSQLITLNSREYLIHDIGEGEPLLLIRHKYIHPSSPLRMVIENRGNNARIIIVDVTKHLPADISLLNQQQISQLIEDLHLLCDIYWLDKAEVHSYYYPDFVQEQMKNSLGKRVITPKYVKATI